MPKPAAANVVTNILYNSNRMTAAHFSQAESDRMVWSVDVWGFKLIASYRGIVVVVGMRFFNCLVGYFLVLYLLADCNHFWPEDSLAY